MWHPSQITRDFSPGDRTENIRRIAEVAKLFVDAGIVTGLYKKANAGEIL
jgi:hypothetical protein